MTTISLFWGSIQIAMNCRWQSGSGLKPALLGEKID
jgi:hypothetical protein